jgi:hypothetical protein
VLPCNKLKTKQTPESKSNDFLNFCRMSHIFTDLAQLFSVQKSRRRPASAAAFKALCCCLFDTDQSSSSSNRALPLNLHASSFSSVAMSKQQPAPVLKTDLLSSAIAGDDKTRCCEIV